MRFLGWIPVRVGEREPFSGLSPSLSFSSSFIAPRACGSENAEGVTDSAVSTGAEDICSGAESDAGTCPWPTIPDVVSVVPSTRS